ncbi:hypothetical protein M3Y99_00504700 [Aphelenchoides fujianensis]|nr:hypothetical protein M3Y99_00504700 [Aphelenchoides fujianensis]
MELPKNVASILTYLSSLITRNQHELYANTIDEIVQSLVQHAATEIKLNASVTQVLCTLASWIDNECVEQCSPDKPEPSTQVGLDLVRELRDALTAALNQDDHEEADEDDDSKPNGQNSAFFAADEQNEPPAGIDDLLQQLALKKAEKFIPHFAEVVLTDSEDDDDDVRVDEQSERRMEKHGSRTAQEEVEKHNDGREIRTKKVSTMNSSKSSKTVTIRITGKATEDLFKKFHDQAIGFDQNEDVEQDVTFPTPSEDPTSALEDEQTNGGDDTITKTKTVQHQAATLQAVSRQAKRNGRLKMDQFSQKLDLMDLNAREVNVYDGHQLVDRQGEGVYNESSIIQNRIGDQQSEWAILLPPRKHVEHYIKTIVGNDDADSKNFFRATALESYITLNDNLRLFEQQQHRQVNYSFGLSGTKMEQADLTTRLRILATESQNEDFISPVKIFEDHDRPQQLSITDKEGILESIDASDYLVFQDAETKEVRGGPEDALAVHASSSKGSLLFQEAFITTFPSFTEAEALIKKLVHRYAYMSALNTAESIKATKQSFSLLIRIVDSLCFVELHPEVFRQLNDFLGKLLKSKHYNLAKLFRHRLSERIEECCKSTTSRLYATAPVKAAKSIFKCSSSDIARQLTHLDSRLFEKIEIPEMIWWASNQHEKKCPNIREITHHFNNVSYWIRSKILEPDDRKEREKRFKKFLKVAKHLKKLGNFNSYLAALSALDSGPVRRLNWPRGFRDQVNELTAIMDTRQSFKNYRTELARTKPPYLPYFGLILQDLTFVHVGNPDLLVHETAKNLLNFGKRWQQYAILDNVKRIVQWNYDIKRDDRQIALFDEFRGLSEEEGWKRSYEIEPKA